MGVPTTLRGISATAGSNSPAGTDVIGSTADDYLRGIQAVVRQYLASVGTNIVSATTTDLSTADGFWTTITGTTTITGLGTEQAGIWYGLTFSGALTLTHNAASLILPGGANITTAAGDTCFAESLGSGNWRIWSYQKASGLPIATGAGLVLLNSGAASGASLDIAMTSYTAYANKLLVFDLIPATDGVTLFARVSTDGGSTYDSGVANYSYFASGADDNATSLLAGGTDTGMRLSFASNIGNGATEGISGSVAMFNTTSTAKWPRFEYKSSWVSSDATPRGAAQSGGGTRRAAQDTDGFQLIFGAGNITSGTWRLYGFN